jgi:hypothetical protein
MALRPLILIAAMAAAFPAFAQQTPENRAEEAAYRAQVAAEAQVRESQQRQVDLMNQQREMQARLDAIEAQRRTEEVLRPPASPTTTLTVVEQQRQRELEDRLTVLEQQQIIQNQNQTRALQQQQQQLQQRMTSLTAPQGLVAIPRLSPFGQQAEIGSATGQERQQAADRYASCLTTMAGRLDDRVSDAATIARAIEPICRAEYDAWRAVMRRGAARETLAVLDQAITDGSESGAIQAVLQARRSGAR